MIDARTLSSVAMVCAISMIAWSDRSIAQSGGNFEITKSTIDGGGGSNTGGLFALSGTIGQPDAHQPVVGGDFALTGGFWSGSAVVQTTICVQDCDCYLDAVDRAAKEGVDPNALLDVCDYHHCDIPVGETVGTCTACSRRFGNTCAPYGGFVQTDDILCAVAGFGTYCACPNGDLIASGGAKGPSGSPLGTDDILAVVGAFGGQNPFACPVPSPATCDDTPPPTTGGCGATAASVATLTGLATEGVTLTAEGPPVHTASMVIVPRQRSVRVGGQIDVDVYVNGVTGLIGYEFGVSTKDSRARLLDATVDTQRRDYVFNRLANFPAMDNELGRVGGVVMDAGVTIPTGKRAYLGTFAFEVPAEARGSVTLQPLNDFVALYTATGQQLVAPVEDVAVIVVDAGSRR